MSYPIVIKYRESTGVWEVYTRIWREGRKDFGPAKTKSQALEIARGRRQDDILTPYFVVFKKSGDFHRIDGEAPPNGEVAVNRVDQWGGEMEEVIDGKWFILVGSGVDEMVETESYPTKKEALAEARAMKNALGYKWSEIHV